jgi:hypothetical protein
MSSNSEQQSPAQALIPFTGFYTLDAATGSFVMVDTNSVWLDGEVEYDAKITISSDGQTSETYPLGPNCKYSDGSLVITDSEGSTIADLALSEQAGVCSIQGTIGGTDVAGSTPFGPIPLSIWSGTYYRQGKPTSDISPVQYPFEAALQIEADGTVQFAVEGGTLQPVPSYWYDYGMFVVIFKLEQAASGADTPQKTLSYTFEMGTASGWGRVAGDATDGSMLVSIRLNEPAPHL